jgi:hypothetical protein
MRKKILPFLFVSVFLFTSFSCKAPRNNIFDPLNPDYSFGTIEGYVQTIGFPSSRISEVRVIWQNANLITETDNNGWFRLSSIPIKDGNLVFAKEGYKSDTLEVIWGESRSFFTQVFFNSLPTLDTVAIYTSVINQTGLPSISNLFVKAWITDLDDDIDTVYVVNNNLKLKKNLTYFQSEGSYQSSVSSGEMGGNNIEETIGSDFAIMVKDEFDNEFVIGNNRVTRVIKDEVTGLHPSGDSTISMQSQPLTLQWDEFNGGYYCTYLVELYRREDLSSQLIHTVNDIDSETTSYTLPFNLPSGNYYWTIWVIDKFQNRSRSKPVLFKIN